MCDFRSELITSATPPVKAQLSGLSISKFSTVLYFTDIKLKINKQQRQARTTITSIEQHIFHKIPSCKMPLWTLGFRFSLTLFLRNFSRQQCFLFFLSSCDCCHNRRQSKVVSNKSALRRDGIKLSG
jgi:hypothetical protein